MFSQQLNNLWRLSPCVAACVCIWPPPINWYLGYIYGYISRLLVRPCHFLNCLLITAFPRFIRCFSCCNSPLFIHLFVCPLSRRRYLRRYIYFYIADKADTALICIYIYVFMKYAGYSTQYLRPMEDTPLDWLDYVSV